jgi:Glycogen recognition site of AMP-activated protein kinase
MEIKSTIQKYKVVQLICIVCIAMLLPVRMQAQTPTQKCSIKDGKMHIEISKKINELALDSFIAKHDLYDLDLKTFFKKNSTDSLIKLGWAFEQNDNNLLIITKNLLAFDKIKEPGQAISFTDIFFSKALQNEAYSKNVPFGFNRFKNKNAFAVKDSIVTFYLRNNANAKQVFVAGTFNKWKPKDVLMTKTDSGWIANVKLTPGKYFYKFVVDDNWTIDIDNKINENDGEGNTNSVFYFTNKVFTLNGFEKAKKVFVAGSFNNWQGSQLRMTKTATGWEIPLYIAEGTHTYRFVVDGKWFADPDNADKFPNEFDQFNSVLRIGKATIFSLAGFVDAKKVTLVGSFNDWKNYELVMQKTDSGWVIPYTLAKGNYEYRFEVDGKTMGDPKNLNPLGSDKNSIIVIDANYTFRIKGFETATTIYLAGDFNGWSPDGFPMKKVGNEWVLPMNIKPGKHLYKLVVDGKWITDPYNNLWEQNEFDTGNSVLWIE